MKDWPATEHLTTIEIGKRRIMTAPALSLVGLSSIAIAVHSGPIAKRFGTTQSVVLSALWIVGATAYLLRGAIKLRRGRLEIFEDGFIWKGVPVLWSELVRARRIVNVMLLCDLRERPFGLAPRTGNVSLGFWIIDSLYALVGKSLDPTIRRPARLVIPLKTEVIQQFIPLITKNNPEVLGRWTDSLRNKPWKQECAPVAFHTTFTLIGIFVGWSALLGRYDRTMLPGVALLALAALCQVVMYGLLQWTLSSRGALLESLSLSSVPLFGFLVFHPLMETDIRHMMTAAALLAFSQCTALALIVFKRASTKPLLPAVFAGALLVTGYSWHTMSTEYLRPSVSYLLPLLEISEDASVILLEFKTAATVYSSDLRPIGMTGGSARAQNNSMWIEHSDQSVVIKDLNGTTVCFLPQTNANSRVWVRDWNLISDDGKYVAWIEGKVQGEAFVCISDLNSREQSRFGVGATVRSFGGLQLRWNDGELVLLNKEKCPAELSFFKMRSVWRQERALVLPDLPDDRTYWALPTVFFVGGRNPWIYLAEQRRRIPVDLNRVEGVVVRGNKAYGLSSSAGNQILYEISLDTGQIKSLIVSHKNFELIDLSNDARFAVIQHSDHRKPPRVILVDLLRGKEQCIALPGVFTEARDATYHSFSFVQQNRRLLLPTFKARGDMTQFVWEATCVLENPFLQQGPGNGDNAASMKLP